MGTKGNKGLINNLYWKFLERISAQLVTTVVSIVLARILDPTHYGLISIVSIFITFANVFVSDGIGNSLIQKRGIDELDYSTLMFFNLGVSILLYLVIFFAAPYISLFYGDAFGAIVPVLRVLGLRIILTSVNSIQHAYISRHMMFRMYFWSTLIGTVVSAIVGIIMAYTGFGVWALVFQYLTNTSVGTIVLAIAIGKIPKIRFSFYRLKRLLGFGVKILGTNLIGTLFNQIRALIIGKVYTSSSLAFFDKGQQFPALIVNNINSSIVAVLFPKMSLDQEDLLKIKETTRRSIRFSTFLLSPILLGMAAIAPQFVSVVLTDKWLPCVQLLQLLCVYYLFWPIHSINMQVMKALGKGNTYLRVEILKKIFDLMILLITFRKGVFYITVGMVVSSVISAYINAFPNKKLINYSVVEQIKDVLSSMMLAGVMSIIVFAVGSLTCNKLILMIVQMLVGCATYIILAIITKNKEFEVLLQLVLSKFKIQRL